MLEKATYSDFLSLYDTYKSWLVKDKVEPSTHFPNSKNEIAVFQFRCNEPISFNDEQRNNDILCVMQIADNSHGIITHIFDVTCDPKSTKYRIAHSAAQIYRGNVGAHRGDSNRPCIRSDYGFGTWYFRTDEKGNIIDVNPSDRFESISGHIGINIHNANGCYNSSLGCTIFSSEKEYQKIFRDLITKCNNRSNIMVALIDAEDLEDIFSADDDIPDFKNAEPKDEQKDDQESDATETLNDEPKEEPNEAGTSEESSSDNQNIAEDAETK